MSYTTACTDWQERIRQGKSIIPKPIYSDTAESALRIFKALRIPDAPGQPTFGESCPQWIFDFVAAIFGAYNAITGEQAIREFMLMIAKKNAKSSISAAIMLTALLQCWREDEEHLIIAPTREVAGNSFDPAAGMVRLCPRLQKILKVRDHIKTIEHRQTGNTLKVISADTRAATGKKAGRILVEELHEFGRMPRADVILLEATGGLAARPEGFVVYLSTQSDAPPAGVFKQKLQYCRNVRDGKVEDKRTLPVIYEFPDDIVQNKEYLDPKNFYMTNPNLGYSVSQQWLEETLEKMKYSEPQVLQQFAAKHLNVEVGLNLRSDNWAGAEFWQNAAVPLTLDELLERSEVVTMGIDGGGLDDMLALYVIGREAETGVKLGWGRAWVNSVVLQRRLDIADRLKDFAKDGDLCIIEGSANKDIVQLAEICAKIEGTGLLDKIGVDPIGLGAIEEELAKHDINADEYIVSVPQGWRLSSAIKTSERWLANKLFTPSKQSLLFWCVGNAKVEQRGNNIIVTKQISGSAKIDPVIAMYNAVALMALNPEAQANINGFISNPMYL